MRNQGCFLILLTVIGFIGGCRCSQSDNKAAPSTDPNPPVYFEQAGVEVCGVRLTSEGYMLDFRYRVVDPDRAAAMMDRESVCYVIDQKSGAKMIVPSPPKVGSLRQKTKTPEKGKIYYVMFANPGRKIQLQDKVTVVIDALEFPDLVVQ